MASVFSLTRHKSCIISKRLFSSNAQRAQRQSTNNQILCEPYPSFLSSLDQKSSLIQQRRYILESLSNCKHSDNVISIIHKSHSETPQLLNSAIFSVAVQRCSELKQFSQCILLMNLMFKYGVQRDLIQYNMVLLSLSKCEHQIDTTLKFLKKMIKKDRLVPDIYTLTHCMQSFRTNSAIFTVSDLSDNEKMAESQKQINKMQKVWNALVHKMQIKPDRLALSEKALIFANYGRPNEAFQIWHDMETKFLINARITTCGLMIRAFAKFGDVKSMNDICKYMKAKQMRMNPVILCSIMHCYMNANLYLAAIQIFDQFVILNRQKKEFDDCFDDLIVDGNDILFGLKAICYGKLLEAAISDECNDNDEKIAFYMDVIHETIPYERRECGLNDSDMTLSDIQLKTKLMTNGNNLNDTHLIKWFERKMKQKSLWCIRKNWHQQNNEEEKESDLMVGVHLYSSQETAKFVLNYVFKHKINDDTFKKNKIIPIVIGKHLKFEDVHSVLLNADIPFSDLRLDPHNHGKVLFEP